MARSQTELFEISLDCCYLQIKNGSNVMSPPAVSFGSSSMIPVSDRPFAARLKPSIQFVAGSTQKKSCPAGV